MTSSTLVVIAPGEAFDAAGAMMVARAEDPAAAMRRCLAELKSLLDALTLD